MNTNRLIANAAFKLLVLLLVVGSSSCGSSASDDAPATEVATAENTGGLSAAELENGIGPVREVDLSAVDPTQAESGQQIFQTKCASCHKFDQRYVGPSLGGVLDRRSPAFVMNMMLNPGEMVQKHPEVKKMLAEFLTPMPSQNLSQEDARAILEYIRQVSADTNP